MKTREYVFAQLLKYTEASDFQASDSIMFDEDDLFDEDDFFDSSDDK